MNVNSVPSELQGKNVGQIRELARNAARAVMNVHCQDDAHPIDPVKVARQLGAEVFEAQLGDDVSGMVAGREDGATIYVDKDNSRRRKRFTIAHEIGHIVSHEGDLRSERMEYVDARSDMGVGTAPEIYANEFAAELLMPADRFKRSIEELDAPRDVQNIWLAEEFDVSVASVNIRRQILGV